MRTAISSHIFPNNFMSNKSKAANTSSTQQFVPPTPALLPPWDGEVSDTASLPQCAQTAQDRRAALDHALNGPWAAEDISMIRRVESEGRCLWVMWRLSTLPPG
jgi:hypothetical protein